MHEQQSPDTGFPGIAFATLPKTGETIAVRYGERLYYRVDTTKTADELNAIYGVTPAQARAILASVMSGLVTPHVNQAGHDPLSRSS